MIVVDQIKLSFRIDTHWPLPVEVLEFGWCSQLHFLERLDAEVVPRRRGNNLFHTDKGNMILDSRFGPIADPAALSALLGARAGIIEHGLFIDIAHDLFVAGANGVAHLRSDSTDGVEAAIA